jgi:hypothetical protein
VVIQQLDPGRTDATAIQAYIAASDAADADYLSSGVCSQQAAQALSSGLGLAVDPVGMDTPYRVYSFLKRSGCVQVSYYTFPDGDQYSPVNGRKIWLYNMYSPECTAHVPSPFLLSW